MQIELGKNAIVVGGASGIGLATARQFAEEGVRVFVWDIAECAEDVLVELPTASSVQVDVRSSEAVQAALATTLKQGGGDIDHLVFSAAIGSGHFGMPFTRIPHSSWRSVMEVNMEGLFNVSQVVAGRMMEQRFGTIVSVASVAGQIGSPTDPPYSASKAAGINFVQCMARDLALYGVRANSVCPGMVKTPLNKSVWKSWCERDPQNNTLNYDEWAEQKINDLVPLKKWQQPEDVANMIVFLSSRQTSHVTGQTINIDGGYVMHS